MNSLPTASPKVRFAAGMVDWLIVAIPVYFLSEIMVSHKYHEILDHKPIVVLSNPTALDVTLTNYLSSLATVILVHTALFMILCLFGMIVVSIICETGPHRATLGKRLLGLEVQGKTPFEPVEWEHVVTRLSIGALSWIFLNIGHAMAFVRKDKLMAHDLASGTRVVQNKTDMERQKWIVRAIQVGFFLIIMGWLLTRSYNDFIPF